MPPHDLVLQCRARRGRGCPPAIGADPTRGGGAEDAGESGHGGALMEMLHPGATYWRRTSRPGRAA